jgi:hypothetical protein
MSNKEMMHDLISISNINNIDDGLKEISNNIDDTIAMIKSLECTEENLSDVKKTRASLRKDFSLVDGNRKVIKNKLCSDYNHFYSSYKSLVIDKFKEADSLILSMIDDIRKEKYKEIISELERFAGELLESFNLDFVPISYLIPTIRPSQSLKSHKDSVRHNLEYILKDLDVINSFDKKDEVLYHYKLHLNLSQAINDAEHREKHFHAEEKQFNITAEQIIDKAKQLEEDSELMTIEIEVTASKIKLKRLREFLQDGGYDYV